jgi:hypothetical protein
VEVVENNYKNIYYIMKHRAILNILILVASAFLLVAVLSYFNLYEGMDHGLYEGLEEGKEKEPKMEELKMEGMEDDDEEGMDNMPQPPATGPVAAAGAETVLKFSTF